MGEEKPEKKLRKPYTITKTRDRWNEEEHDRFLEALSLFGRDWKKVEDYVGTKTVIQIRSHAQKYFLKAQKNGIMAHVPPPRPKRKAAYPSTAKVHCSDNLPLHASSFCFSTSPTSAGLDSPCSEWDTLPLQSSLMFPVESACIFQGDAILGDTSILMGYNSNNTVPSMEYLSGLPIARANDGSLSYNSNISWKGNSSQSLADLEVPTNGIPQPLDTAGTLEELRSSTSRSSTVLPNLAEAYNFIANMIDPETKYPLGVHLQKLKMMDRVTADSALLMIRNLTNSLNDPGIESHLTTLSAYDDMAGANNTTIGPPTPASFMHYGMQCPSIELLLPF